MITKNRVLLLASGYTLAQALDKFRFEAIEIIHDEREIKLTWSYNKTPLMLDYELDEEITSICPSYPILEVPRYHIMAEEDFIIFCHENGIECGEYVYGKKIDTSTEHCFLCNIAGYGGEVSAEKFNKKTERVSDTIIYESANFFVKIELGCLKKGMLMINPKQHFLSAALLPDNMLKEYYEVMHHVEWLLKSIYGGPVIFFEHGSAPDGFSSHQRSIVHAHTHVCPGIAFDKKYLEMVSLKPVKSEKVLRHSKYFSYQEGADGQLLMVNNPKVYVQRQYPRQVIAEMLGIPNNKANWRVEPFWDNMLGTFDDIFEFLTAENSKIPENIRKRTDCFVNGYQYKNKR